MAGVVFQNHADCFLTVADMREILSPQFGLLAEPAEENVLWQSTYSYLLVQHQAGFVLPTTSVYLMLDGSASVTATVRRGTTKLTDSLPVQVTGRGFYRFHFPSVVSLASGTAYRVYLTPALPVAYMLQSAISGTVPAFGFRVGTTNRYDLVPLIGFTVGMG